MKLKELKTTMEKITAGTNWGFNIEPGTGENKDIYNITLYLDSTGEDVQESAETSKKEKRADFLEELQKIAESYDANEHFKMWYGANKGEPSEPGDLWEACQQLERDYNELKGNIIREKYAEGAR